MGIKQSVFANPGKIPNKVEYGRDKLNDPIEIELKRPRRASIVHKSKSLSYDELSLHYRVKCPNVLIHCNSCDEKLPRDEFREHPCYIELQDIDYQVLVNQKA